MPQMSPMNWILLMIFILLNYLVLMLYLYFNFNNFLFKKNNFNLYIKFKYYTMIWY